MLDRTSSEIRQAVLSTYDLYEYNHRLNPEIYSDIRPLDFLVGIYYENINIIPDSATRRIILNYFLSIKNLSLQNHGFNIIKYDLKTLNAQDLEKLSDLIINLCFPGRELDNSIIAFASSNILEEKALPFKVVERFTYNTQHLPSKSKSYKEIEGLEEKTITETYHTTFDKSSLSIDSIPLKNLSEFIGNEHSSSSGDKKHSRIEMRNNTQNLSSEFIYYLAKYIFQENTINARDTLNCLFGSKLFQQLIFLASISCATYKQLILKIINNIHQDNRDTGNIQDLLDASYELEISTSFYFLQGGLSINMEEIKQILIRDLGQESLTRDPENPLSQRNNTEQPASSSSRPIAQNAKYCIIS